MIGDVVFTTPIPSALTRTFPDSRISYLVEPAAAPVVAGNPHLADVIVAPRRRGLRRIVDDIRLAGRLRAARFDVVIDLHGGPRSSWLTWATGARQRIGYDIEGRRWHYTQTVHRPRDLRPRHSVENQWDLLAAIDGWPGDGPRIRRVTRSRCRSTPPPRGASTNASRAPASTPGTTDRGRPRQRGQPVPPLAGASFRQARGRPR